LALKAAYLHAQHPEWDIAVTFQTRSLRGQFKRLINTFTIEQTGDEPDWSRIRVLPSWGAPGGGDREGVYHTFCTSNSVPYRDFARARAEFGSREPLAGACRVALNEATNPVQVFDVILVDEAQDLPPDFLRMCYLMLGREKRLVYAYDELQTLNGSGLPPAEEIFGFRNDGTPLVSFNEDPAGGDARRDIILEKCYRNSRPVLVTAHALGFGIYREPSPAATTGLVQIFEQKDLWNEIGYASVSGGLEDNQHVVLERGHEASPRFLEEHSPLEDLLHFERFASHEAQASWIADRIAENLENDELVPNDIIVINPDPFTTRENAGLLRRELFRRDIDSHLAGVDTNADIFFKADRASVTVTGVFRAKGNEAGMVYVMNAHESLRETVNLARIRNRLFTAITRSKAWVRVTGVGSDMDILIEEYKKISQHNFRLSFRYPTEAERAKLQILHRDLSKADETRVKTHGKRLIEIVEALESGELFREDLDGPTLERLNRLLGTGTDG
jgi:superfamily I DNA and RNA helicase